jgi:hypothetical protein
MSAVRQAVRSLVHTTTCATPTQLVVFAAMHYSMSPSRRIGTTSRNKNNIVSSKILTNKRMPNSHIPHTYQVGDQVMVKEDPHSKLKGARFSGPYMVNQVYDDGTVHLSKPPMVEQS